MVSQTLLEFGHNQFKAQIGITAVLHTWGQTLIDHYHLHCIVTGGGLKLDGSGWISSSRHYLFAVRALSKVFSGKFRAGLQSLYDKGALEFHGELASLATAQTFKQFQRELATQKWVVYAKRPFAEPRQVLAYLSRYTHDRVREQCRRKREFHSGEARCGGGRCGHNLRSSSAQEPPFFSANVALWLKLPRR